MYEGRFCVKKRQTKDIAGAVDSEVEELEVAKLVVVMMVAVMVVVELVVEVEMEAMCIRPPSVLPLHHHNQ